MTEQQRIAHSAFMLGVNWTLKVMVKAGEHYGDFNETDAKLIRDKAAKVLKVTHGSIPLPEEL